MTNPFCATSSQLKIEKLPPGLKRTQIFRLGEASKSNTLRNIKKAAQVFPEAACMSTPVENRGGVNLAQPRWPFLK